MTHYIGVVASLAIRRSPASTQPANLLLIPARAPRIGARGRVHCVTPALQGFAQRLRMPIAATFDPAEAGAAHRRIAATRVLRWIKDVGVEPIHAMTLH